MKRMLSILALLGTFCLLPLVAQATEYTITIEPVEHATIKVTHGSVSNPTEVHSGDKLGYYEMLTIQVTPDEGYEATHYIVNGVEKPLTSSLGEFEFVKGDLIISAKVVPATKCTVTITPPENGTLSVMNIKTRKYVQTGDQLYSGTSIHMSVMPKKGYDIEAWLIDGESYKPSNNKYTHNSYTYTVQKDVTISVKLKEISQPTPSDYKVTMIQPKEGQGTMTASYYNKDGNLTTLTTGNSVPKGTYVTFEVTPAEGYEMDHWMIDDKPDESTSNTKGIIVEANLKVEPILKNVGGSAQPTEGKITMVQPKTEEGSMRAYTFDDEGEELPIQDGQSVKIGTNITFAVTPAEGYKMSSWKVNDETKKVDATTPNKIKLTVTGNLKVEPVLKAETPVNPTEATLTVKREGTGATISGKYVTPDEKTFSIWEGNTKQVPLGSKVTLTANLTKGFEVTYMNNDTPAPEEALSEEGKVYTFTVQGNVTVVAKVTEKQVAGEFTVTCVADPEKGGKVSASTAEGPITNGGKVAGGEYITVKATPNEDFEVDQWFVNTKELTYKKGSGSFTFALTEDVTIKVTFKSTLPPAEYAVTVEPALPSAEAGEVHLFQKNGIPFESGKSVVEGTEMYVEVTPAAKYELETLQVGETKIPAGDEKLVNIAGGVKYTFTVKAATKVQATFKLANAIEQLAQSDVAVYVTNGGTRLEIAGAAEGAEVRLYDYTGQLLLTSTEHTLNISALPAGSYIVLVGNYTTRIVK